MRRSYCRILVCDEPVAGAVEAPLWRGAQYEPADLQRAGADLQGVSSNEQKSVCEEHWHIHKR